MANNNNIVKTPIDNTPVNSPIVNALLYYATHDFKKSKRINVNDLGSVELMHAWNDSIIGLLDPAYKVWTTMHDNMGNNVPNATPDKSVLYSKLRTLCDLIGEVNGFKLLPENLESLIIGLSCKSKDITISNEMAHAESQKKEAIKARAEASNPEAYASASALVDQWTAEIKRLGDLPGHKKAIYTQQAVNTFRSDVELLMRDAVAHQNARPIEDIIREREERDAARKAARKAKKAAKAKAEATAK